jgi:MATE family multidrug resistance protein
MVISLGGTVLNYLLNYALIEGMFGLPKLGLMGIGLVTAIVANGMALALAWHIRWHRPTPPTRCAQGCASNPVLRELWRLGLPIGGTYAVEVGLFAFAALCMGTMGSTQLAAHQIALQIVSVAFMVPAGMSYASPCASASTTAPGNCCGAHGRRVGIGFGAAVMLGLPPCSGCCRSTGRAVPRPQRPGVCRRDLAVSLLAVAAWFELFDGVQTSPWAASVGSRTPRPPSWSARAATG